MNNSPWTERSQLPTVTAAQDRLAVARTLRALLSSGPLQRGDLRRLVGVSSSTVTQAVASLFELGAIVDLGKAASTGGRPPGVLDVSPSLGGVLAADVGGARLRAGAADLHGALLHSEVLATPTGPAALRRALLAALERAQRRLAGPVRALCLAIAGTVNADSHEISLTTNISGWRDTKPPTWLAGFGVPVLVENEANMAAFSEYRYGAAANTSVALFLALGAGVGAGLLINGELFRGATGAAGEIGQSRTTSRPGDEVLEQRTAAPGLLARYRQMQGVDLRNPVELFSLAEQGDRTAVVVVEQALDQLAIAVTNAILLVDPQRIIVGGGISTAGDLLLKPLQERVSKLLATAPPEFVLGKLGPDAALLGAAAFAAQAAAERLVSEVSYIA